MIQMVHQYPELPITRLIKIGRKGPKTITANNAEMRKVIREDKFSVVFPIRSKEGNYMIDEKFASANVLPIEFRLSTPEDHLRAFLGQWYPAGGYYICRGNGVACEKWDDAKGTFVKGQCPCEKIKKKLCKPQITFYAAIPGVNDWLSWSRFRTQSWNSLKHLDVGLRMLYSAFGDLRKTTNVSLSVAYQIVLTGGKEKLQPIVRLQYSDAMPKEFMEQQVSFASLYSNFRVEDVACMGEEEESIAPIEDVDDMDEDIKEVGSSSLEATTSSEIEKLNPESPEAIELPHMNPPVSVVVPVAKIEPVVVAPSSPVTKQAIEDVAAPTPPEEYDENLF